MGVRRIKETIISYLGIEFRRRKKKKKEVKIGEYVNVYTSGNKPCGCNTSIKEVVENDDGHNTSFLTGQFFMQTCEHDVIEGVPLRALLEEKRKFLEKSTKRKLSKYENTDSNTSILGVLPNYGPLEGNNYVDICFNVSHRDGMNRYRCREFQIGDVFFGSNKCLQVGGIILGEDNIKVNVFIDHELYDRCSGARFVIQALVPPGDSFGSVDISIGLVNRSIVLENGYTYILITNDFEDGNVLPVNTNNEDDGRLNDEHEDDIGNLLGDVSVYNDERDTIFDFEVDVFGGSVLSYAIAQNRMNFLKKYFEEWGKNSACLFQSDVFGYTPIDVARYYEREEILEYLEPKIVSCQPMSTNVLPGEGILFQVEIPGGFDQVHPPKSVVIEFLDENGVSEKASSVEYWIDLESTRPNCLFLKAHIPEESRITGMIDVSINLENYNIPGTKVGVFEYHRKGEVRAVQKMKRFGTSIGSSDFPPLIIQHIRKSSVIRNRFTLFFCMCEDLYYSRYVAGDVEEEELRIKVGEEYWEVDGLVNVVRRLSSLKKYLKENEPKEVFEKCMASQFAIGCYLPTGRKSSSGIVDVELTVFGVTVKQEGCSIYVENEDEDVVEEEEEVNFKKEREFKMLSVNYESNIFGATRLHYAAASGDLNLVKRCILEENLDYQVQDILFNTPTDLSRYFGEKEVMNYLLEYHQETVNQKRIELGKKTTGTTSKDKQIKGLEVFDEGVVEGERNCYVCKRIRTPLETLENFTSCDIRIKLVSEVDQSFVENLKPRNVSRILGEGVLKVTFKNPQKFKVGKVNMFFDITSTNSSHSCSGDVGCYNVTEKLEK